MEEGSLGEDIRGTCGEAAGSEHGFCVVIRKYRVIFEEVDS